MAKGRVDLGKATTVDCDKAIVEENMGPMKTPGNKALQDYATEKDIILA